MEFAKRMEQFGEGVFSRLAEMRKNRVAEGKEVFDLSIGAPNIPPAKRIMEVMAKAVMEPKNYVYAINDTQEMLQAVAQWYQRRYGVTLDADTEICSLLGSQDGLSHIALSILDAGDVMLVPDPCYPIFADGPRLAGAELYYMPQKKENDYVIQLQDIPEEVAKKAKFMLVSYPNNPTAAMAPESFYHELVAFAKKYDIIVLHDNAYSELVFDGRSWGSFLSIPGAKDVGVEFNSLSKTYGLAGARIGYCLGNSRVVSMLKTLKSNMDYGMFLPIQAAAVEAITGDQSVVAETRAAYERRRDVLCDGLIAAGWQMDKPPGTMFVWAPVPEQYADSESFVRDLLDKTGVLVTPGSAFGPSGEGYVRMALVQSEEDMQRIVEAVKQSGIFA
ncbi:MAG: aminotransferase class I/II-fold pyridoxal phosphate-dependent enzyme [Selenomonadaceae bacterium]|uniref:aminotransferase class I/II-fold pyridoxal phosphate-dependent enzyme n=1 Tax=Anaerovibrio slackiae TaxID=2652309 RepID=UPI00386F07B4|nr:aminotransferase class I/II-fold pyridoxal phosphate-dependent enzyme [Selenomonadaceae bacterium]MBQ5651221.1 aminotransferase class I/II-fold pyridoxal phosphate-dependent enzyme [Selenomonadaceae bacterium]MBR0328053.1 aminotransferase class I/II-fold pyridoxal phosphate-dependent enzyme [Selenomonadaceae bacterium]